MRIKFNTKESDYNSKTSFAIRISDDPDLNRKAIQVDIEDPDLYQLSKDLRRMADWVRDQYYEQIVRRSQGQ